VGRYLTKQGSNTLIEHWNGRRWKVQPSPNPAVQSQLLGVIALPPGRAWAVGSEGPHPPPHPLIEYWNGRSWKVQRTPSLAGLGSHGQLESVAAASATNVWAVGSFLTPGDSRRSLIEHWNGRRWRIQASPDKSDRLDDELRGVAVISPDAAWAVGYNEQETVVKHWNGQSWTG
jgi:hypothetical protein